MCVREGAGCNLKYSGQGCLMNMMTAYGSKGDKEASSAVTWGRGKQAQKLTREPACCAQGLNKAGLAGTGERRGTYREMRAERGWGTSHIRPRLLPG